MEIVHEKWDSADYSNEIWNFDCVFKNVYAMQKSEVMFCSPKIIFTLNVPIRWNIYCGFCAKWLNTVQTNSLDAKKYPVWSSDELLLLGAAALYENSGRCATVTANHGIWISWPVLNFTMFFDWGKHMPDWIDASKENYRII